MKEEFYISLDVQGISRGKQAGKPQHRRLPTLSITRYSYGVSRAPRLLVTGAIHGDEPTAAGAIWYFEEKLDKESIDADITVVPCSNPLGLQASSRLTPLESGDINRSFPGRGDGSLAERTAAALAGLLADHDALVDVHTAGWCVPFALIDPIDDSELRRRVHGWAASSGFPVVREMQKQHAELQGLNRSWSAWAVSQNKPAFTLELSGSRGLEHSSAVRGGDALVSLTRNLQDLFPAEGGKSPKEVDQLPHRAEMFADAPGLFEAVVQPGQKVKRGELLGWIKSLAGVVRTTVQADHVGTILALQPVSAVNVGGWLATIAAEHTRNL